jgi:hypothetical protein
VPGVTAAAGPAGASHAAANIKQGRSLLPSISIILPCPRYEEHLKS